MIHDQFDILVIGGGHAGTEAAWAAANLGAQVALITMDPDRIGQMSCNPAIGGLAKGQIVREIDALGGLMGLAIDATGIQFRMLNMSKGPAVRGPRAQADKYAYAKEVQRLIKTRHNITVLAGMVDDILTEGPHCRGIRYTPVDPKGKPTDNPQTLKSNAVILTTGTFMSALMHTGENKTKGGRVDEPSAEGLSGNLKKLGFDLGRLKTGTPPRLAAETIQLDQLPIQPGDDNLIPFSDLTLQPDVAAKAPHLPTASQFPILEQKPCWVTGTNQKIHDKINQNLDRAPMYSGQITTAGPRYCPSIEDKVVRFADRSSHHIFLEPESLTTNEIYCNGISTSLPADVQDYIIANIEGCENAKILKYGYAVEYDMVRPNQIDATCMTKPYQGLFFAGQINGTSGYEEAGAQGLLAGLNAVRFTRNQELILLSRDQAYIGVMMDDLVTKIPVEPYRMFTSRAEHRLMLRADNAPERLTPFARELGLIDDIRWSAYEKRKAAFDTIYKWLGDQKENNNTYLDILRRPQTNEQWIADQLQTDPNVAHLASNTRLITTLLSTVKYQPIIERHVKEFERVKKMDHIKLPTDMNYDDISGLRNEAKQTLKQFQPATLGQASRLAGINPADMTILAILLNKKSSAPS